MREIKFRDWIGNTFHYWGFLRDGDSLYFQGIASSIESLAYKLEHSEQYTGLYDKNGEEIYEGDIVKGKNGWLEVVKLDNYGLMLYLTDTASRIKVIGNIYENPELLRS